MRERERERCDLSLSPPTLACTLQRPAGRLLPRESAGDQGYEERLMQSYRGTLLMSKTPHPSTLQYVYV